MNDYTIKYLSLKDEADIAFGHWMSTHDMYDWYEFEKAELEVAMYAEKNEENIEWTKIGI